MSKTFYVISIVAVPAAFMVASWFANAGVFGGDPGPVRAWSMIASFYAFGVFIVLWYRAWGALSDGPQKFNAAKTAGLLMVPLFNLYWFFKAVWGWPKTYNYYAREKGLAVPPLSNGIFLTYCVFTVAAVLVNPGHIVKIDFYGHNLALLFVSQVTKTAQLCFDAVIVWTVCGAVNRLPRPENTAHIPGNT